MLKKFKLLLAGAILAGGALVLPAATAAPAAAATPGGKCYAQAAYKTLKIAEAIGTVTPDGRYCMPNTPVVGTASFMNLGVPCGNRGWEGGWLIYAVCH